MVKLKCACRDPRTQFQKYAQARSSRHIKAHSWTPLIVPVLPCTTLCEGTSVALTTAGHASRECRMSFRVVLAHEKHRKIFRFNRVHVSGDWICEFSMQVGADDVARATLEVMSSGRRTGY